MAGVDNFLRANRSSAEPADGKSHKTKAESLRDDTEIANRSIDCDNAGDDDDDDDPSPEYFLIKSLLSTLWHKK